MLRKFSKLKVRIVQQAVVVNSIFESVQVIRFDDAVIKCIPGGNDAVCVEIKALGGFWHSSVSNDDVFVPIRCGCCFPLVQPVQLFESTKFRDYWSTLICYIS
jgi:hypothetical protein